MRLRFTARAVSDLVDIAEYLRAENSAAAKRVRASILESLRIVAEFPRAGRPQNIEGVRKLVTRKYGYLIYYAIREEAGEAAILTIRHPARNRSFSDH